MGNDHIRGLYRYRHLVDNAFARLKQFRALATRFDKLKECGRYRMRFLVAEHALVRGRQLR